jgi:hypothetical protein
MNRNANREKAVTQLNGRGLATVALALAAFGVLASGPVGAQIPEPDHIFYGPVPEGAQSVMVTIAGDGVTVATYAIGVSDGGQYVLRLPMDSIGERSPGTARPGDEAAFHVDGARVASATVGEPGVARFLELGEADPGGEGIGIRDASVVEGDTGMVDAVFELTLGEPRQERVVVYWAVEEGTASLGEDFLYTQNGTSPRPSQGRRRPTMLPGGWESVTFAPGADSQRIVVPVICDREPEEDETFFVHLMQSTGAPIDREIATGTIVDDDDAGIPTILVTGSRFLESEGSGAGVAVTLSRASDEEISVDWVTVDYIATSGSDFAAASGTLIFAPGETSQWIGLTIHDDAERESDERFLVVFSRPVGAVLDSPEVTLTILDDDGPTGPELRRVRAKRHAGRVSFARMYSDPVVTVGAPTDRERAGAAVAVGAVDGNGFDLGLRATGNSQGLHGTAGEDVSYLVLERGRHVMEDGSIWETGTFELERTGTWVPRSFAEPFPAPPAIFLTPYGPRSSSVRARSVGTNGFEAAGFGSPAAEGEDPSTVVGYLAVYSPAGSGTLRIDGEPIPYLLQRPLVGDSSTPVLSWNVGLEPGPEAVASEPEGARRRRAPKGPARAPGDSVFATPWEVLIRGAHLVAREADEEAGNPVVIHARPPEHGAPLEWGAADSIGPSWTTVPLAENYDSPVIVAKPVVEPGSGPFSVRVRGVTERSFQIRCEPWSADDHCAGIRISYLVAEEGSHELGGLEVRAGAMETDRRVAEGWREVGLGAPMSQVPAVFAAVQTDHNPGVRARVHNRNADWFDVGLEVRGEQNRALVPETVAWIAVEPGTITTSDGRRVESFTELAGQASSTGRRPMAGKRPPSIPSMAAEATLGRVTIADTGSNYSGEPAVVYQHAGTGNETTVVVPGGEQGSVAEEVCILRAD